MDIVSLPIIFDRERIDSRFRLVVLSTERARQLMSGAKPVVPTKFIKETTIALEELVSFEFDYVTGKEVRKVVEEAMAEKELRGKDIPEEGYEEDETKKEIEKDIGVYIPEAGGGTGAEGGEE